MRQRHDVALVLNPAGWRGVGSLATQVVCWLSFKILSVGIELISAIRRITAGKRRSSLSLLRHR